MAKKGDNTKLIVGAVLLAGVGYLLLKKQQQPHYYNYPTVPPPPAPPQTPAWYQWANAIVDTFGNVADLWQPGGPFFNQGGMSDDIIYDNVPGYDDPYDYSNIAGIGKF